MTQSCFQWDLLSLCRGDHFIQDCLVELAKRGNREPPWPRVLRFCGGCGIDHLSKDCPTKHKETRAQGKTTLHYVEAIEEPNESEKIPLRVITRAQAKDLDNHSNDENTNKPRRKMRRKAPNKVSSPKNSQQGENHSAQEEKQTKSKIISKAKFGGSILLEKVNENLESLLKAFKGTTTPKNHFANKSTRVS